VGPTTQWEVNDSIAPIASSRAVAARTLEAIRVFDPDVLHLHEPLVPGPTHAAVLGTDVPSVATFHSWYAGGEPGWYKSLRLPIRKAVEGMAVHTAVSEEAARQAAGFGAPDCRIVPNGVDVTRFAKADPWPADQRAVLFVGRHEPRKGLRTLLDAWSALERDAVLWVAGHGPETDELRARAIAGVEWLGRISDTDLSRRMRAASVFCAPAVSGESFGVVLLEAMAAGTPVVATDIAGYRNVARADREAVLVAPGDPTALRAALRRVLDDARLAADLVSAGELRADEFSFAHLAERYLPLYQEAILRPPARRSARE
jgi:phosphatidylinositol alpha-mannosyltransferase